MNRLAFSAIDTGLTFRINGQQVASFEDEAIRSGVPGIYTGTFDAPDTFQFDNIVISSK